MTDVYQKYMHRIAIAITTRLQDQGKGLIMLPMNPLPILFPSKPFFFLRKWQYPQAQPVTPQQRSASPDRLIISSIPSQALLNISTIRQKSSIPSRERVIDTNVSNQQMGIYFPQQSPQAELLIRITHSLHPFTAYACIQHSHLFQHNTKHLMHHDIA